MTDILAGVGLSAIELTPGLQMAGYIGREHGAVGIHDTLQIKTVTIKTGPDTMVLASCDLLGFQEKDTDEMAERIMSHTGIPVEHIVICCTHTHSAPAAIPLYECGEIDAKWLARVKKQVVECALLSLDKMRPATLQLHQGRSNIAINRVVLQEWGGKDTPNWETRNWDGNACQSIPDVAELADQGVHADTFLDDEVLTLSVHDDRNGIQAVLVNYACHPVTLEHTNYEYSADFLYHMEQRIQARHPDIPVLYLNGCCGDLNPRERGGYKAAGKLGTALGEAVLHSLRRGGENIQGSLAIRSIVFPVPLDIQVDEDMLLRRLQVYKRGLAHETSGGDRLAARVYKAYIRWADEMLSLLRREALPSQVMTNIRVIRIGCFTIVAIPFELFHEIGISIKEGFGRGRTMIAAYANGENGYVVSSRLYPYAKYERYESFKFTPWPGAVAEGADKILLGQLGLFEPK